VAEFISLPGRTEGHVSLLAASWWLLSAPKGTLPPSAWGPLHNTAVCFFKASRGISLSIRLRESFMQSSQKSDNPIILTGDGHLGGHLRLLPATEVSSTRREEQ